MHLPYGDVSVNDEIYYHDCFHMFNEEKSIAIHFCWWKYTSYSHHVSIMTDGLREKWNLLFCCLLQANHVMLENDISSFEHETMDGK